ncbi:hypothetical protein AUJ62_02810 [Candidatus Pacearchaeota archaeon CG1_02_32_21]|nr:MAG: hypothetical protein AUJ62_02810 [Candidatus Pacearchaeota archaeon CG1_02_32_21]
MKIIWSDKNFNYYFLLIGNLGFGILFLSLLIYSVRNNLEIWKVIFWLIFTLIGLIGTIYAFKIPRAKITINGIWTGDLFIKNNEIKPLSSIFIPWDDIKRVIIKKEDMDSYKEYERGAFMRLEATTIHLPITIKTKNSEIQFLVHNFKGFINAMKKIGEKIIIK